MVQEYVRLFVLPVVAAAALAGCAGVPPKGLESDPPGAPTPRAVQADPVAHVGAAVRWGGEILGVLNHPSHSDVEVFARALFDDAEPRPDGGEGVRFIARINGFVDPVGYAAGKRVTVRGTVRAVETRPVGEFPYRYPVVAVQAHHLWPVYRPPEPYGYRDPFYDPWWPWGPWGPYRYWPYGW